MSIESLRYGLENSIIPTWPESEDEEWADIIARRRNSMHPDGGYDFRRDGGLSANKLGAFGEIKFARVFKMPLDMSRTSKGDGGVDFPLVVKGTPRHVDVKTSAIPLPPERLKLYVRQTSIETTRARIYVLAQRDEARRCTNLIAWETLRVMRWQPIEDPGNRGVPCHSRRSALMRPMRDLAELIAGRDKQIANAPEIVY